MKGKLPVSRAEANFDARLNIISQTLTLQKNQSKRHSNITKLLI